MIRAGAALAMQQSTLDAARAAAEQACHALAPPVADVVFVFATAPHAPQLAEACKLVREITLARQLVGCTASGVFTLDASVEGGAGIAVLALASDGELQVVPFQIADVGVEPESRGETVGRQLRPHRGDPGVVVLLPDVGAFSPASFLEGLEREIGSMPVVGAAACDDGTIGQAFQMAGDTVLSGGATGALLHGRIQCTVALTQSVKPATAPLVVTRARGNVLVKLGGKRAFDAFLEFVNEKLGGDLRRVASSALLAVYDGPEAEGGDYYVRQIVGIDPEGGLLGMAEPIAEGQTVSFTTREPGGAWKSFQTELHAIRRARGARPGGRRPPAFGLFFNCAARTSQFFGAPSADVALVRQALGDFPLVGVYGGAEIAPVGGRARANYFSGVLLLVDELQA